MNLIPDTLDFSQYMEETESHAVYPASHWIEQTIKAFYPPDDEPIFRPPTMLWDKTSGKIHFRPGEVSLWAGINGHGKSMFLSQVMLDLCKQKQRCMVASFEMPPVRQMQRMTRQAFGEAVPGPDFLRRFSQWGNDKLWIYDHVGSVDWKKLIAVMRYAVKNFGVQQFVIDSMMKCVNGEDDYNGQKNFVNELCAFAQANNVHVHLVHHVRKGEHESKTPGKFDIKGAGSITDLVDNIFICWRNKKLEDEMKEEQRRQRLAYLPQPETPSYLLACEKQRNGEHEGKFGFWFHPESQQFIEHSNAIPIRYEFK